MSQGKEKTALGPIGKGILYGGGIGAGGGGLLGYTMPHNTKGQPYKNPTSSQRRRAAIRSALGMGVAGAYLGGHVGDIVSAFRGAGSAGRSGSAGGGFGGGFSSSVKPPSWLGNPKTKVEAKKIFRAHAYKNHPDRGGSGETMKRINAEFSAYKDSPAFSKLAAAFLDELQKMASFEGLVLSQLLRNRTMPPVMDAVKDLENEAAKKWQSLSSL